MYIFDFLNFDNEHKLSLKQLQTHC